MTTDYSFAQGQPPDYVAGLIRDDQTKTAIRAFIRKELDAAPDPKAEYARYEHNKTELMVLASKFIQTSWDAKQTPSPDINRITREVFGDLAMQYCPSSMGPRF